MNSSFAQLNSKVEVTEEKVNEFEEKSRDIYQFNKDKEKDEDKWTIPQWYVG